MSISNCLLKDEYRKNELWSGFWITGHPVYSQLRYDLSLIFAHTLGDAYLHGCIPFRSFGQLPSVMRRGNRGVAIAFPTGWVVGLCDANPAENPERFSTVRDKPTLTRLNSGLCVGGVMLFGALACMIRPVPRYFTYTTRKNSDNECFVLRRGIKRWISTDPPRNFGISFYHTQLMFIIIWFVYIIINKLKISINYFKYYDNYKGIHIL